MELVDTSVYFVASLHHHLQQKHGRKSSNDVVCQLRTYLATGAHRARGHGRDGIRCFIRGSSPRIPMHGPCPGEREIERARTTTTRGAVARALTLRPAAAGQQIRRFRWVRWPPIRPYDAADRGPPPHLPLPNTCMHWRLAVPHMPCRGGERSSCCLVVASTIVGPRVHAQPGARSSRRSRPCTVHCASRTLARFTPAGD